MARGKRKRSSEKQEDTVKATRLVQDRESLPSLLDYLLQFVAFVAFCLISAGLVYLTTGETLGLQFFFTILILGFFVVCVFSFIHDRLYREEDEVEAVGYPEDR